MRSRPPTSRSRTSGRWRARPTWAVKRRRRPDDDLFMGIPFASFRGRFSPRTEGRAFLARVARRVEAGFLMGRPHFRSRYAVASHAGDQLAIRSEDFWTDFNVGLNEISLRLVGDGAVEYEVTFWRWLRGCIVMCGAFAILLLAGFVLPLPENLSIPAQLRRGPPADRAMSY